MLLSCHMLPHVAMFVVKIYLIFTVSIRTIYIYIRSIMYMYVSKMELGAPICFEIDFASQRGHPRIKMLLWRQPSLVRKKFSLVKSYNSPRIMLSPVCRCLQWKLATLIWRHLARSGFIQIRCSKDQRPKSLMMLHRGLWLYDLKWLLWTAFCIHYRLWKKKSCII